MCGPQQNPGDQINPPLAWGNFQWPIDIFAHVPLRDFLHNQVNSGSMTVFNYTLLKAAIQLANKEYLYNLKVSDTHAHCYLTQNQEHVALTLEQAIWAHAYEFETAENLVNDLLEVLRFPGMTYLLTLQVAYPT